MKNLIYDILKVGNAFYVAIYDGDELLYESDTFDTVGEAKDHANKSMIELLKPSKWKSWITRLPID